MFFDTSFLKNDEIQLMLEKTVGEDIEKNWKPGYHFAICNMNGQKIGKCDFRIGYNEQLYYGGNIGYQIDEAYRGNHYAAKACLLLFELAKMHNMNYLIITCNPDNYASRKTCEYAGGQLLEIAELPLYNNMRLEGATEKCIYKFSLNNSKAIIFDFDYTLGDSTNGIVLSITYALEKLGYAIPPIDIIKKTIGLSLIETYAELTAKDNDEEAELFKNYFIEKADEVMVASARLYDGVLDVLRHLKEKGYCTGIVTTKFSYRIEKILYKYDANDLIDIIVGADNVKVEKPNPEGLNYAVDQLGISKNNVIYIGDSFVDAQTAKNANVRFAGVLTGTTTYETFMKYENVYIGENVLEVLKNLDELYLQ